MNIATALKSDRVCKALTGLRICEFRALADSFQRNVLNAKATQRPNRKRKIGGGRRGAIPHIEEKLFTALIYLKCYPTYDLLGFLIGLDRTRAWRWIQYLFPILQTTLGHELVLPKRQIRSVEEFLVSFPEIKDVFVDGTDRRIQKPKNIRRRNKLYSGKRKTVTRKNVVLVDEHKRVLVLSKTKSGRRHDKKVADDVLRLDCLPAEVVAWLDTGFAGVQKYHANVQLPKKRNRGHPLSQQEKENNAIISSFRVVAEHALAGIKRLRSTTDVYRNRIVNFDDKLMLLSTGIWNYHLKVAAYPTT